MSRIPLARQDSFDWIRLANGSEERVRPGGEWVPGLVLWVQIAMVINPYEPHKLGSPCSYVETYLHLRNCASYTQLQGYDRNMMDIYQDHMGVSAQVDGNLDIGYRHFSTDPHERVQPLVKASSMWCLHLNGCINPFTNRIYRMGPHS